MRQLSIHKTLGILFYATTLTACSNSSVEPANQVATDETVLPSASPFNQAVIVETVYPQLTEISEPLIASGTIAAKQTSNIGALVPGVIETIHVKVGDRVEKGQPLFQTRRIGYVRRVAEAEAALSIAKSRSANAETLYQRYARLIESDAVSRVDYEDVQTKAQVAKAEIGLRQAQLDTAQQALSDTTVRSPFAGAITARYVDEGVFMSNSISGLGNSSVVQVRECEIAAGILFAPQAELGRLELGLTGKLFVDGRIDPILSKIIILNDSVDHKARTVEFRMAFKNPDCAVKAGQSVRAEIDMPTRSGLTLPRQAVWGSGTSAHVFVVDDNTAIRRPISMRDVDANRIEILSGLNGEERVVLSSSVPIKDGNKVEIAVP